MAAANPDPSADPQQYQQDSLQVDASQWSQSRSARRKQKRKEHTMQCSPMVAGSTVTCTVQPTKQLIAAIAASESTDTDQNIPAGRQTHSGSAVAVVAAASGAQPLHAKQRSKRSGSRAASPLGKKQDAGNRGRGSNKTSLQGRLDSQADRQQDVEAVQIVLQEEAESQIMASSAVSRARAANADFCQVERSHRSGSNVGLSPRRALLDLSAVSRTSSDSRLVSQLSSATSLVRAGSAELPQLTDPEIIQKVVKKIKAIHVSCNSDDSNDVVHMLGSIQATLKAYAAVERLWLVEQPFRVKHIYLCKCFPGTDAKMVHAVLSTSNSSVDQAITVLEKRGLTHVPSAFCLKDVFQGVQKMDGSQWVVVWDTCALMKDLWVGYQLLEEVSVYQVIPFMTHLELNHIKDDKSDPEKAHKGQEVVKLVSTGLQAEYKGRFKLQPEYGEPPNAKDFLPPLTADRDSHIGDDHILQCAAFWDNRAQQLTKQMVFLTNDIALTNRALSLGIQTSQAPHWLKHSFS
ncbi:TPA: hypothetical protein ACH3X1_004184 [Trebouxia sp. C0004]